MLDPDDGLDGLLYSPQFAPLDPALFAPFGPVDEWLVRAPHWQRGDGILCADDQVWYLPPIDLASLATNRDMARLILDVAHSAANDEAVRVGEPKPYPFTAGRDWCLSLFANHMLRSNYTVPMGSGFVNLIENFGPAGAARRGRYLDQIEESIRAGIDSFACQHYLYVKQEMRGGFEPVEPCWN